MTVSGTDALTPSALAVIIAVPTNIPFARPELSTVAAPPELEKTKVAPDITAPCWSLAMAWNCLVPPTTTDAAVGETEIVVNTNALDALPAETLAPPPQAQSSVREINISESGNAATVVRDLSFRNTRNNFAINLCGEDRVDCSR